MDPNKCDPYEEVLANVIRCLAAKDPKWSQYQDADITCVDRRYQSIRNLVWVRVFKLDEGSKGQRGTNVARTLTFDTIDTR